MLSKRFNQAFDLMTEFHQGQVRKSSDIPFISHLMAVCALALEAGCDEDTAIACLLHDAIEDGGGNEARQKILAVFGPQVASIVEECTETDEDPKPPWQERKDKYLSHLQHSSPQARTVALCDKVHNARSTLQDLKLQGPDFWAVFNAPYKDQIWWYESLVTEFNKTPSALSQELADIAAQLKAYDPNAGDELAGP